MTLFQFFDADGQVFVVGDQFPHANKSAHDEDVHLDCALSVQDGREHSDSKFGECKRRRASATASDVCSCRLQ
jgi:hypothetical protein